MKSYDASISDEVVSSYKEELRNLEKEKNKKIKSLERELEKQQNVKLPNSTTISIQTDADFQASVNRPPSRSHDTERLRNRVEDLEHERNQLRQQNLEKDQNVLNCQIDLERRQLRINQLEQEVQRFAKVEADFGELSKQLESVNQLRNERDMLDNYLRQALDDRQVFEKRSYDVRLLLYFSPSVFLGRRTTKNSSTRNRQAPCIDNAASWEFESNDWRL